MFRLDLRENRRSILCHCWPRSCFSWRFKANFSEKGMKALDDKHYQDAVEDFTRAIAADPADYTLHFNLALAYSLQGKDAEAVGEYKKTLGSEAGSVSGRSQSGHHAAAP